MKRHWSGILVLLIALAVAAVAATEKKPAPKKPAVKPAASAEKKAAPEAKPAPKKLPKLLELGSTKCISCKRMMPILDELETKYKGKLEVEFIDVWENRDASEKYRIQVIPTQIFIDGNGKEISRHTGFFSKEKILATFKEKGIDLDKSVKASPPAKPDKPAKTAKPGVK